MNFFKISLPLLRYIADSVFIIDLENENDVATI